MTEPIDLQPVELLQLAADFFESHNIAYRVVGSMASIAYGENRFTNDVDMVVDLRLEHVDSLCRQFTAPSRCSILVTLKPLDSNVDGRTK